MLHIHLFGNLRLFLDGQSVRFPGLPKTLPLWAYLLLQRRGALTREQVAFTLWPDEDEANARSNLRRHLHDLRRVLPSAPENRPWLLTDSAKIQWNPDAESWLDVAEFEATCQNPHRLDDAIALYTGDLLPGIYDDWIFFDRERLRNDFFAALNQLVQQCFARQEYRQGIDYVLKLLAHDPLREDAVRDLMLLRSLSGDRTGALREYKQFEGRLATELNVAPMPETNELYRAIIQNEMIQPPSPVAGADLPIVVAPPTVHPKIAHNIPATLASFIGREDELNRVCQLLQPTSHSRLLTLTGTVGSGKTRLALEMAHRFVNQSPHLYPDGIFFVSLGAITEPEGVIPAIAATLGVSESGYRSLIEDVKAFLSPRRLLLILDNFEQVNAAAPSIGNLLTALPHLRVLVTSRSVLHIYGEYEFPVPPLALPDSPNLRPEEIADFAAVALFVERASAVNPKFRLDAGNASAVAQICLHLDGLPLALELAAARCKLFTPAALLNRLSSRLDFLNSQIQHTPTRQQTLRSIIEWSHNLLSANEKALFAQLSVFVGEFTLEAAEAVVAPNLLHNETAPFALLDGLTGLIDQNMLRSATPNLFNDDPRFRMLLILREFASEELSRRGQRDHLLRRHASYYVQLAEDGAAQLHGPQQVLWLEYLEAEVENLRAALAWALTHQEVEIATRLAIALGWFWTIRGHLFEGQDWLNRVLALPESCAYPHLRAEALIAAARLAHFRGDYTSQQKFASESLDLCRVHGPDSTLSQAIYYLGISHLYRQDYAKAEDYLKEALIHFRQLGDRYSVAMTLAALSMLQGYYQQYTLARSYIEESMTLYRALGDTDGIASALLYMATLAYDEGDYEQAQILFERCLPLYQTLGNKPAMALAQVNLSSLAMIKEESELARSYAEKALPVFEETGERWQPPRLHRIFAYLALEDNNIEAARALCQESFLANEKLDDQRGQIASIIGFAHVAIARGDLTVAAQILHGVRLHLAANRLSLLANDLYAYQQAQAAIEAHLAPHTRLAIESATEIVPLKSLAAPFLTWENRPHL